MKYDNYKLRRITSSARKGSQRGFVFVAALVVIAGLVALMTMIVADQRVQLQDAQNKLRSRRAEIAAKSAVAGSLAVLQSANTNSVTLNDAWATYGNGGDTAYEISGAKFRVQIVDAGSMLNLNTVINPNLATGGNASATGNTPQQLAGLPLTQEQTDSLLDWCQTSTTPRANGAKDEYYNGLQSPYNAKLGPLATLDELLLVKGWTAETLYKPQDQQQSATTTSLSISTTNAPTDANGNVIPFASIFTVESGCPATQSNGSARIDFSTPGYNNQLRRIGITNDRQISAITQIPTVGPSRPAATYRNFQQLLSRPINQDTRTKLLNGAKFSATVTRYQGKININTAPQAVLQLITGMGTNNAQAIVSHQSSGFNNMGEITSVVDTNSIRNIADSITTGSDTWIVRAYGECNGVGIPIEVVVGMRNSRLTIITWNKLRFTAPPEYWGWNSAATSTDQAENAVTTSTNSSTTSSTTTSSTTGGTQ